MRRLYILLIAILLVPLAQSAQENDNNGDEQFNELIEDARDAGAIDPEINLYSHGEDPRAWGRGRADMIRGMFAVLPEIALDVVFNSENQSNLNIPSK